MSTTARMTLLVISLFYAFTATAQQTKIVVFDTVKTFEIGQLDVTITGIEKDTGANVNIVYRDDRVGTARCIAMILTALEKPGRYLLTVASRTEEPSPDPPPYPPYFLYCRLELKT